MQIRLPFWRRKQDRELQEELQSHLAMAASDRVDRGQSRADAEMAARRDFGNTLLVQEVTREMWGWAGLERCRLDVRYGLRLLLKSPAFAAVAILTLALGIGANTALFSVVNGVLLNPLPYAHPEQLATVFESKPHFERGSFSYLNFLDFQQQNQTLAAIAAYRMDGYSLTRSGPAEHVRAQMITADFFPLLGIQPVAGRIFTKEEDRLGATPVVIISTEMWQRKFGGSPDVIGTAITLDGNPYVVVGVVPSGLDLAIQNFRRENDIYVLMGQYAMPHFRDRSSSWGTDAIARLKPGVTVDQTRADLNTIATRLAAAYPGVNKGIGITMVPLEQDIVGEVRPILLLLLGAVGFVLLIACGNVANLLLARSTARAREFAVRAALGASQTRIIRQLLTESLLLSLIGGALAVWLARWSIAVVLRLLPNNTLPRPVQMGLDGRVLLFTLVVAMLAAVIFGLIPALKISRPDLHSTLKEGGRGSGGSRHRVQAAFVILEMAMAVVLLAGAGLMVRTLVQLWRINLGFDPHHVALLGVDLPPEMNRAPAAAIRAAWRRTDDAIHRIPGIEAAAFSDGAIPLRGDDEEQFWLEGQPKPASMNDMNWTLQYVVQPAYFQVMRVPLQRGRLLTDQDDERAARVAVIDEALAARYFPNTDPIGKHIHLNNSDAVLEVVGVVGHVKQFGPDTDALRSLQAQMYVPFMQTPDPEMANLTWTTLVLRSALPVAVVEDAVRRAVQRVSADYVVTASNPSGNTMEALVARQLAMRRFSMILLAGFAALALMLASIGIYGVVSYVVGQRTQEVGVRMALGARRIQVLRMMLMQGARMAVVGVVIGLAAAFALTRLMTGMLYGVKPADPLTFAAVALLLSVIALAACYIPARRATHVDPMQALRWE